jgi:peptide/nickel transport system substrate-binding protein
MLRIKKFVRFLRNGLFLVLVASLVLILSCVGYAQQTPTKEKIIQVAQSWPCYIDPAVGQDNVAVIAHINLYEQLVMLDEKGEVTPKVAKSWDFDPASNTYTFYLVKGIKFHNGDILTANDVIFSLKRLLTIGEGWSFLFKNVIGGYSAPDPETVVISLKQSYGPFLSILIHLHILNEKQVMSNIKKDGLYGEFGDYGKEWLVTHDAGSGPYMVKEMKTAEYLYAVRFPDYWGGWDKDAPDSFKLIGTTEPVTVRTLMSRNQLEITDEWQPTENYEALGKIPGVEVAYFNAGGLLYLDFNTSKPPLDDVHFRRALMYIFDYKICYELLYPMGKRTNGPVGSALPGWDSTLPFLERDVERAKTELAQSKYADQLDKYPVEFAWVSEVPDEEKVALLLQSNASEIGIKIEVTKNPWLTMVSRSASAESTPHIFTEIKTSIPYPEAGALLEGGYHSIGRGTFANVHWFTDEIQSELDQLIEEALSTADNIERYAKYSTLTKKIIDLASDIWAVEIPQRHAYHADYVVWPDADAAKAGQKIHIMPGQRMYFNNMKFISEKAP